MRTLTRSKSPIAEVADTVTDVLSEAWSSGSHLAKDLVSTAAERATDLGSVAAEHIGGASNKVVEVVGHAPDAARSRKWWLLPLAAVAGFVAAGWWMRRRRQHEAESVTISGPAALADYRAAAGS